MKATYQKTNVETSLDEMQQNYENMFLNSNVTHQNYQTNNQQNNQQNSAGIFNMLGGLNGSNVNTLSNGNMNNLSNLMPLLKMMTSKDKSSNGLSPDLLKMFANSDYLGGNGNMISQLLPLLSNMKKTKKKASPIKEEPNIISQKIDELKPAEVVVNSEENKSQN